MRFVVIAAALGIALAGPAAAQSGLDGALERNRQDLSTQQGEFRREIERQGRNLQQQQDQSLQFQLLQRHQPVPPTRLPSCIQVGATFRCQ